MAINEILPFAPNAKETQGDILSQVDYESDIQRLNGQSGLGRRALNNKALRQSAHIAAGVAQFIANRYGNGVKDDGDLDKIEEGLKTAVEKMIGLDTIISETTPLDPYKLWLKPTGTATITEALGGTTIINLKGVHVGGEPPDDKDTLWIKPVNK